MREGIGSIMLYNIIIIFIALIFAILAGTLSYNKSYIVNSKISLVVSKYEGYVGHEDVSNELRMVLDGIGYRKGTTRNCKQTYRDTGVLMEHELDFDFCLYRFPVDDKGFFTVGVLTYMDLELPLIGNKMKIPVYSTTSKIYAFSK